MVRTGNGIIRVASGSARPAEHRRRSNAATSRLHIADDEDLNVLGMNFLSSLERWGVEGRWLVLQP